MAWRPSTPPLSAHGEQRAAEYRGHRHMMAAEIRSMSPIALARRLDSLRRAGAIRRHPTGRNWVDRLQAPSAQNHVIRGNLIDEMVSVALNYGMSVDAGEDQGHHVEPWFNPTIHPAAAESADIVARALSEHHDRMGLAADDYQHAHPVPDIVTGGAVPAEDSDEDEPDFYITPGH